MSALSRIWQRAKPVLGWALFVIIPLGFLNTAYWVGYHRGHYVGQLDMKCAIFGVLDKMSDASGTRDDRYSFINLGCRTAKARGES